MTYDSWKARNPDDEFLGPRPVDEPDELELVHRELHNLREAVLNCTAHVEEDADFDGERYVNQSTYHLAFSRRAFLALLDALGIEAKTGQSDIDAFVATASVFRS